MKSQREALHIDVIKDSPLNFHSPGWKKDFPYVEVTVSPADQQLLCSSLKTMTVKVHAVIVVDKSVSPDQRHPQFVRHSKGEEQRPIYNEVLHMPRLSDRTSSQVWGTLQYRSGEATLKNPEDTFTIAFTLT